jgi:hypothetical protein
MGTAYGVITRCLELQETHIADAVGERHSTRALLERLAVVSVPNSGVAKALLVYARLGTTACDWIDGDLAVDLVEDDGGTRIETSTELGGGMGERLFKPMRFDAPLAEFARAIARVPHMIAPLTIRSSTPRRIRLSASAAVRRTTAPPPPVEVSAESLFLALPGALPKEAPGVPVVDSGLPVIDRGHIEFVEEAVTRKVRPPATSQPPTIQPPATTSEPPIGEVDGGWDD